MTTLPSSPAPPLSRRTVIKHAGLAAAALAGLSACTNYGSGGGTPSGAPATGRRSDQRRRGARRSRPRTSRSAAARSSPTSQAVITQPTAGEFKAFTSICTHQNCPVTEVTDTINCNCHGSKFSITDGSVVNPPATQALAAKQVSVEGEDLTIA